MVHPGGQSKPIVSIKSVTKKYDGVVALDNVTLDIEDGEFIALLGPSGCGKTTLLRSIGGFVQPDVGEILLSGQDVSAVPPYRRDVNTVFQNYSLFPHMTVANNVGYGPRRLGGRTRKEIEERVTEMLALVDLLPLKDRYPSQLSGGQQQRVALARALANRPKVLLLDEPLAALDLQLRKQMQIELKHMQDRLGMTFILVTHDQEEALVMADRIAIMQAGRIVQVGKGDDVYWRPSNRFVATFIGATNLIDCELDESGLVTIAGGQSRFTPLTKQLGRVGQATFSLRMEDVKFGLPIGNDAITERATVVEKIFLGGTTHVYTRTPGGTTIVSSSASPREAELLAIGEEVTLHWLPNAMAILND